MVDGVGLPLVGTGTAVAQQSMLCSQGGGAGLGYFLLPARWLLAELFPVYLSCVSASSPAPLSHYALHLRSKCLLETGKQWK